MILEMFAGALLKPVTKFVGEQIFGEHSFAASVTESLGEIAKDKLGDVKKAREAARKLDDLAFSIIEGLSDFAEHERFDAGHLRTVVEDIQAAITVLDLGEEVVKAGRNPAILSAAISRALPRGLDPDDAVTALTVTAFSDGLCRIATDLPSYEQGKDVAFFAQLDRLLIQQTEVARDLTATRQEIEILRRAWQLERVEKQAVVDQNERQYRAALAKMASQVKLLGLEGDKEETGRKLPIETAYVPLRLRRLEIQATDSRAAEPAFDIEWDEVLELLPVLRNRLLIEGIGGSGKTTLLQWAAMQALATGGSSIAERRRSRPSSSRLLQLVKTLADPRIGLAGFESFQLGSESILASSLGGIAWFERVPLFVRLRDLVGGRLPSPQDLPRLIADTALGTSVAWVRRAMDEKRAIFLLDGIDEIKEEDREQVAEKIEAYLRDYEGCPVIATSRPAAVQDSFWGALFGPCRLQVGRMARPEIEVFVRHWYKAYGTLRKEPRDERAVDRLLSQLEAREGLVGLMDTPLLAASICFLNKDRTDELPTRAPELYAQLCRQLVHQLDEDRLKKSGCEALMPALKDLDPEAKLHLLADLAQLMVNNMSATLDREQAIARLGKSLRAIGRETGRDVGDVLDALQERSGLLRGSTLNTVEFAHNNLRGWLAARAYAEDDENRLPVERAFDLKDFDLPMLTAAQSKSTRYRDRLIDACLELGKGDEGRERIGSIMALRCGVSNAVSEKHRANLDRLVQSMLPPRSSEEAAWLSEQGESIIDGLVAQEGRDSTIDTACVRCLRLIGGEKAKAALASYLAYENEDLLDELAQALPPLSIPRVKEFILGKWQHQEFWRPWKPARHVKNGDLDALLEEISQCDKVVLSGTGISDFNFLAPCTTIRELYVDRTAFSSLNLLSGFAALQTLCMNDTQVGDVEPLRGLAVLQNLQIDSTQISDIEPLRGLAALQNLQIGNTQVSDLKPLSNLKALQYLQIGNTQVSDLKPLRGLTALKTLYISNTQVSDLEPLRGLTELESLYMDNTLVSDLDPLRGLAALRYLSMDNTQVSELEPLRGLTALQLLWIVGTRVSDLKPLRGLTALRSLWMNNSHIGDLEPLSGLTELRNLQMNNTQVSDLNPLRGLSALRTLSINGTQVSDLEPLRGLTELEQLHVADTQVSDLGPLQDLKDLRIFR